MGTESKELTATVVCLSSIDCIGYLDGGQNDDRNRGIQQHLDRCERCRVLLAETTRATFGDPQVDRVTPIRTLVDGETLGGRYEIRRFIARGGMGEVYEAADLALGETVALKTLAPAVLDVGDAATSLIAEVRLARKVVHPNVCRILEFGLHRHQGAQVEAIPFLTMELLDGETLTSRLRREGPLAPVDALRILSELTAGLHAVHQAGIVHRDFKTENAFLVRGPAGGEERAVVMDFGLARALDGHLGSRRSSANALIGTVAYMAPEQVEGKQPTPAFDVYALGIVAFEMMTGRLPFVGESAIAVATLRLRQDPPRPSSLRPELGDAWDTVIGRCLAREPSERFGSMAEISDALHQAVPPEAHTLLRMLADDRTNARTHAPASWLVMDEPPRERGREELTSKENQFESMVVLGGPSRGTTARSPRILRALAELYGGRSLELTDEPQLLVFANPLVATDRAVRAVRCGLALRSLFPDARVTVVTGRGLSHQGLRRYAATASDVATAANIVRIDRVTAELLPGGFSVAAANDGFTVSADQDTEETTRLLLGRPAPFVGREGEMATLLSTFDQCAGVGLSRAVLVTAAAGLGKSRLRSEFVQLLRERRRNFQMWLGRGDPLRLGSPFALVGDAVRRGCEIRTSDPLPRQLDKLRARVSRTLTGEDATRATAFLGEMIGAAPSDTTGCDDLVVARQDPALMAEGIRRAWEDWLRAECKATPVVLVLEDLHWGDASSVKLVEGILKHEQGCLVLGLTRPEVRELFPALLAREGVQEIHLAKLSRRQSAALVQGALGEAVGGPVIERVVELGGGHPLYLEELSRHVAEGRGDGLPETVVAMVQARLEGMEPDARRVLRAAAIFGEHFWSGGVMVLVGPSSTRAPVESWLTILADREVIERRVRSRFHDEPEWIFRHAMVRDAAYAMLTDADRTLGHRLVGAWLADAGEKNQAALATHFERGEDCERAATAFAKANEEAIRAEAMEEAERYFHDARRNLGRLPASEEVLRRGLSLAFAQLPVVLTLLRFPWYLRILLEYEPLAETLGDEALLGTLHARLGESLWALGRYDEAIGRLERAAELCSRTGAHEEAGYVYKAWIASNAFRGRFAAALALRPSLDAHMKLAPNPRWHTYGLGLSSMSWLWLGRGREAIAAAADAMAIAETCKQPGAISFAAWVLAFAHTYGGDVTLAVAAAHRSIAAAVTIGDRTWAECALATARCREGDAAYTIEMLSRGLAMMRGSQFAAGEMFASALVQAHVELDHHQQAEGCAREMLRLATGHGMQLNIGVAHRHLAEIALARAGGDLVAARQHVEASVAMLTAIGAEGELAWAWIVAAKVYERAGQREDARRNLAAADEAITRLGSPWLPRDLPALRVRLAAAG